MRLKVGVYKMKEKGNHTFIVKILNEQNETWQGSITWVDTNEVQYFRSALEMLRMMGDAIGNKEN